MSLEVERRARTPSRDDGYNNWSSGESDSAFKSPPGKKNRFKKNYSKKPPALPNWTKTSGKLVCVIFRMIKKKNKDIIMYGQVTK